MLLIMLFNRNSWYVFIVTDTHQKLLLCRQGGRPLHSQNLSVLFLPLYPWTSANRVCVGNKGRKEHSPLPRGIKHKSTDAQVLEFKPLSFMDPNQKIQADENIGPICLTSCFLWSHTQLYFPEEPGWSTPLQPPNSNKSSPWRTSHSPSCGGLYALKHAVTAIRHLACHPDHSNTVSVWCSYYVSFGIQWMEKQNRACWSRMCEVSPTTWALCGEV